MKTIFVLDKSFTKENKKMQPDGDLDGVQMA